MGRRYGETTLGEKLGLAPALVRGLLAAFVRLLSAPVRGDAGAPTVLKHATYGVLISVLSNTTTAQQQYLLDDTDTAYQKFAKKKGFDPKSIHLTKGSKGHWLGRSKAHTVFLYFHGGGFVLPCSPDHMEYVYELQEDIVKQGHDIGVILLSYSQAPQAVYPTQLTQAIELLRNLIEVQGIDPANIVIGGDSAGGNLALGLLSHILHPHPSGVPEIKLSSPLKGAVLISPWVSFDVNQSAFATNANSDMLNGVMLKQWSKCFLSTSGTHEQGDSYAEAVRAPSDWWDGLDRVVNEVLVWGGGGEVLIDSIKTVSRALESSHSSVTTIIPPRSCHEEPIMDTMLRYKKANGAKAIDSWIAARL